MPSTPAQPKMAAPFGVQNGLFSIVPLNGEQVLAMREKHGIYMAGSGRINLAGLTPDTIDVFARAFEACLQGEPA